MNQQNPNMPNGQPQQQQQPPQQQQQQQQQQVQQQQQQVQNPLNLNLTNEVPNANWRDELSVQDRARFVSQL